jgi:PP-loop superfamily ATP-utilizing enzyme
MTYKTFLRSKAVTASTEQRVIVWFSCGAASAVCGKEAINKYGKHRVELVYCDTSKSEDEDNIRFRSDVEKWLGVTIKCIRSEKFSSVDEVIEGRQYLAGIKGAPCTVELKKIPALQFSTC